MAVGRVFLSFPFYFKSRTQISHEKGVLPIQGGSGYSIPKMVRLRQNESVQTNLLKYPFSSICFPHIFPGCFPIIYYPSPDPFTLILSHILNLLFFVEIVCKFSSLYTSCGLLFCESSCVMLNTKMK